MFVSVIIPTYNYGKYLRESVGSALGQTCPPDEVIVVDDGSTDGTPEVMRTLLADARLRYIRNEKNQGVAHARNLGIRISRGDVIGFLDADDIWRRDKLQLQLPLFQNPRVGVVYSLSEFFDQTGVVPHRHVRVYRGQILHALMTHNIVCASSAMVRRECFERVGLFDPSLPPAEDFDLWLRVAVEGYEFDYVNEPLVKRRVGHPSLSCNRERHFQSAARIFTKFFRTHKDDPRVTPEMKRLAWASFHCKDGYWRYDEGSRVGSMGVYLRAVCCHPLYADAWRGVAKCLLPRRVVSKLRNLEHDDNGLNVHASEAYTH